MWKAGRTSFMTGGSILLAFAPKCPICFLAYFGVFGVATASTNIYRSWMPSVTAFWLALTVAMLAFQWRGRIFFGPATIGVIAALLILFGRLFIDSHTVILAGIVALIVAALWRVRLQKVAPSAGCTCCTDNAAL